MPINNDGIWISVLDSGSTLGSVASNNHHKRKASSVPDPAESKNKEVATNQKETSSNGANKEVKNFKQFDIVEDFSDHYFSENGSQEKADPKEWIKKVLAEWKILENDLPETIYVRVYEARMELLRAVIVGPCGTPYHDGLFVFDFYFPFNYPTEPPTMMYTMRHPPKHFEDFVAEHFRGRARDILLACKAYTEGALVGTVEVKNGVVTTTEPKKRRSKEFKAALKELMKTLTQNFIANGSNDLEAFRPKPKLNIGGSFNIFRC
ncbi:hypothetical protein ACFE04_017622 [Oxalis oulophora]